MFESSACIKRRKRKHLFGFPKRLDRVTGAFDVAPHKAIFELYQKQLAEGIQSSVVLKRIHSKFWHDEYKRSNDKAAAAEASQRMLEAWREFAGLA